MSTPIDFYYHPWSRARIAHWMLEETGAQYTLHLVDLQKGAQKQPPFLKINPMGKVPTLCHNGEVITETTAIVMYLAEAFPHCRLAPAVGEKGRGSYLRWMLFIAACMEPAALERHSPRKEPLKASQAGFGSYEDTFAVIKGLCAHTWALGEDSGFSAVDLLLSANLGWYMHFGLIQEEPLLSDYVRRCQDRPAFIAAEKQAKQYIQQLEEKKSS